MNRHISQSQTGRARTIPPYVAIFSRVANASSGPVNTSLLGVSAVEFL
jgi:hypothetical protein